MNAQLRRDVQEWDAKVSANRDKVLQLERSKVANNVESVKLEQQLRRLQQLDRDLSAQHARLQQIVAQQRERLVSEESKNAQQQRGLRQELQNATHQLERRKEGCKRLSDDIQQIKKQLAEMPDVWRAEAVTLKQRLTTAHQERTAREVEHETLSAEMAQHQGLLRSQQASHSENMASHRAALSEEQRTTAELSKSVEILKAQCGEKTAELAELTATVQQWEDQASKREQEVAELQKQRDAARHETAALRKEHAQSSAAAQELQERKRGLERRLSTLQQQAAEYQANLEAATAEYAQLTRAAEPPSPPSDEEKAAVEELTQRITALQLQNQGLLRSNAEYSDKLEGLKRTTSALHEKAAQQAKTNESLCVEMQREEIQLEQLQAEQSELSAWYAQQYALTQAAQDEADAQQTEHQQLRVNQQLLHARIDSTRSRHQRLRKLAKPPEQQAAALFARLSR